MDWRSELIAGLTEPSWPALALGVIGGLAGAGGWVHELDVPYLRAHPGLVAASPLDEGAFGTARLLALAAAPPEPAILVMGGSSVREAVTSIPDLDSRLRAAGVDAPVHFLAGVDRHLWQTEAIVALAPDAPGLVVLPLDATQLSPAAEVFVWDTDTARYGVDLPVLDAHMREAGFRPGPLATRRWFDTRTSFALPRAWYPIRRVFPGPVAEDPHEYNHAGPKRPSWAYAAMGEYFRTPSPREVDAQLVAASGVVDRARNKGYDVVLLRTPRDRSYFSDTTNAHLDAAQAALDTWAEAHGLDWWDPGKEAAIRDEELYDWCHVFTPDAERRWTTAFVRVIAARWKERHP